MSPSGLAMPTARATHEPSQQAVSAVPVGVTIARPRLLDLFCCAGGAGVGYSQAGFDVVGVDIAPQPRYPFEFIQADVSALDVDFLRTFDAIHASPPCQIHSITAKLNPKSAAKHGDFIDITREKLVASGKPYVIENVPGAPLLNPVVLCGTMFGLRVFRHRLFESNVFILVPSHQSHRGTTNSSRTYSTFAGGADMICVAGHNFKRVDGAAAMGIDWPARREEIAQAIPPAYTRFIGEQLLAHLRASPALAA